MKLGEKIRHIRKDVKQMKLNELHAKLATMFGKDAISYKSLIRIEKDRRDGRLTSIHQIACGLWHGKLHGTATSPVSIAEHRPPEALTRANWIPGPVYECWIKLQRSAHPL